MIQKLRNRARRTLTGTLAVLLIFSVSFPSAVSAEVITPSPSPLSDVSSTSSDATTVSPAPSPTPAPTPAPTPSQPATTSTTVDTPLLSLVLPTTPTQPNSNPGSSTAPTSTDPTNPSPSPATPGTATPPTPDQTVTLQNTVDSAANSGNAAVLNNDHAGDATSGKAAVDATIVNVVSSNTGVGTTTTFVRNIYNAPGSNEIQGSITIDPNTLLASDSTTSTATGVWHNPTQGSVSLTDIENNVILNATSGNADVTGNDHAGNATTGDASALANIINVVSSSIGAQHSFLGVINIFGNLLGDILVPSSLVDSLFGGNSLTGANATSPSLSDNITIANNVNLNATSGTATVADNDHAGNATTGNALTNLNVYNLTGQNIIAKNSLLVFVNVLGKWVGMIINAPAGSTTAAFTGSDGGSNTLTNEQSDASHNNTVSITNNVTANATSGNATVADNDHAGNATTGNATAGANILNLVHSSFSLGDWFGVLFINVLGSWLGNFGIAPDQTTPVTPGPDTGGDNGVQAVRVFRFTASTPFTRKASSGTSREAEPALATVAETKPEGHVLGAKDGGNLQALPRAHGGRDFTSAIAMLSGLLLLLTLASAILRHRRKASAPAS